LAIFAFFGVGSTLATAEIQFGCSPVVIAQHVAAFRLGRRAWAMLRPYFSYLLQAQSDFGHSGPLCVHVLFPRWCHLESDFLQNPGCRANRSDCFRAFTRRSD
jgi:hypothetical protein